MRLIWSKHLRRSSNHSYIGKWYSINRLWKRMSYGYHSKLSFELNESVNRMIYSQLQFDTMMSEKTSQTRTQMSFWIRDAFSSALFTCPSRNILGVQLMVCHRDMVALWLLKWNITRCSNLLFEQIYQRKYISEINTTMCFGIYGMMPVIIKQIQISGGWWWSGRTSIS